MNPLEPGSWNPLERFLYQAEPFVDSARALPGRVAQFMAEPEPPPFGSDQASGLTNFQAAVPLLSAASSGNYLGAGVAQARQALGNLFKPKTNEEALDNIALMPSALGNMAMGALELGGLAGNVGKELIQQGAKAARTLAKRGKYLHIGDGKLLYRAGRPTGAPPGYGSSRKISNLIDDRLNMVDEYGKPEDFYWYDRWNRFGNDYVPDPTAREKFFRVTAMTSPQRDAYLNSMDAIQGMNAFAKGELPEVENTAGRAFHLTPEQTINRLAAALGYGSDEMPEFTRALHGVGPKVDSFYRAGKNPLSNDPPIDRHMWKVVGWPGLKEKGGETQHRYAQEFVREATSRYNAAHGTEYSPAQMQAALWMSHLRKTGGSATDFEQSFLTARQIIPYETIPSESLSSGKWVLGQSPEVQREYNSELATVMSDGNGGDWLAQQLNIPLQRSSESSGLFEGKARPNVVAEIFGEPGNTEVLKDIHGNDVRLQPLDSTNADLYALGQKYVYDQDAVGWFNPQHGLENVDDPRIMQGVGLKFHSPLDNVAVKEVTEAANKVGIGFTKVGGNEVVFVNFDGLPRDEFFGKMDELQRYLGGDTLADSYNFGALGDYHGSEKGEAAIAAAFSEAGRHDLFEALKRRRELARTKTEGFIQRRTRSEEKVNPLSGSSGPGNPLRPDDDVPF